MGRRALQFVGESSNGFDASMEEFEQRFETNFKAKRLGTLQSSHYMASIFNEQCATTSTLEA